MLHRWCRVWIWGKKTSWPGPTIDRQIIPSGYLWVGGDRPVEFFIDAIGQV
ncbi:MAG: hypothetical protein HQ580_05710 [Planctomycetes bacterium]|nr:hypothetical protein [Planctomycetota bacterium]